MVTVFASLLVVLVSASPQVALAAQARVPVIVIAPAGDTQELVLKDGTRAVGRVETIDGESFRFRTASGVVMEVDAAQVSALGRVASSRPTPLDTPTVMQLSGPRVGLTYLSGGIVATLRDDTYVAVSPVVTQFGWQWEKRFYSRDDGLTALTEWVFLLGGLDQGVALPSLSWLVGLRTVKGVEFAVGPNFTPVGASIAAAAGVNLRVGRLNFPVNLAVVPSKSGVRVSVLTGFNARR